MLGKDNCFKIRHFSAFGIWFPRKTPWIAEMEQLVLVESWKPDCEACNLNNYFRLTGT